MDIFQTANSLHFKANSSTQEHAKRKIEVYWAFERKLFLDTWRDGAEFPVRHFLPDCLQLCGVSFLIRSLVIALAIFFSQTSFKRSFLSSSLLSGSNLSIKIWLPHNWSLFTTAYPYKIWQSYLEKPTSSFKFCWGL